MNKNLKKHMGRTCCLFSLVFLLPLLAYWVMSSFILTSSRLKYLLVKEINEYVNGEFDCKSVELTYWETWPLIGVAISGGEYFFPKDVPGDSLLSEQPKLRVSFDRLLIRVNVLSYLEDGLVTVKDLSIRHPEVYVRTGDDQPFDLLRQDKFSLANSRDTLLRSLHLDVRELTVDEGRLTMEDYKLKVNSEYSGIQLCLNGAFSAEKGYVSFFFMCDSSRLERPDYSLLNDLPLRAEGDFAIDWQKHSVKMESAKITFRNLPFKCQGTFCLESSAHLWMDASWNLSVTRLDELLGYVPAAYQPLVRAYDIQGNTSLNGTIKGHWGKDVYPDIQVDGLLSNGSLRKKGEKHGLDSIALEFAFLCPSDDPEATKIEVRNLDVSGLNCFVKGQVEVKNLLRNPFWDVHLKGNLDFDRLGREFFDPDTIQLSGRLRSDVAMVFKEDDLKNGHYDRIWADGSLEVDKARMYSDIYALSFFASNIRAGIGYRQNRSYFIKQREVLGFSLRLDTLNLRFGQKMWMVASNLDMFSNTGLQQDTGAITPVTTHLNVADLQMRLSDKIAVSSRNAELHLGVKPSDKDKGKIGMAVAFTSDTLEYLNQLDQQATLLSHSRFVSEIYQDKIRFWKDLVDLRSVFQQCDMKGFLSFDQLRSFSRHFPLLVDMRGTRLGFKNNRLILDNAKIQVGKSDALVSGEIVTYPFNENKKRMIEADLSLSAHSMDCDELLHAISLGNLFEEEKESHGYSEALLNIEDIGQAIRKMEESKMVMDSDLAQLLDLPENLSLSLSLNADKLNFHEFDMQEVQGSVSLREKKAYCDFSTRTNMGDTHIRLLYKNRTSRKADVYLDWDMSQIRVGKLRRLFPAIETLFPMFSSIDGVLDCKLTSYCPIDSVLNVDLDALSAVCSFKGKNMVLFTNDTFHQIASKLYFKDKERNLIDHISADFIAKDHKIDIFPFLLDMDRYRFIIGGVHSMDMSFNYHIDVLKSPVPFDFGLNMDGKIGDFKYKLGKTRYTGLFNAPIRYEEYRMSKQRSLDEEKAKIMKEMREYISKHL